MRKHLDRPEPENDSALLHAWQDGDQAAGTALVRKHFPLVYRFFRSKLDQDIDGLVERTLLICRESGERYREAPSMRAYLLGIARSQLLLCVHVYTQPRVRRAGEAARSGAGPRPLRPEPERPPERPQLLAALRALPVDLQIAVELSLLGRSRHRRGRVRARCSARHGQEPPLSRAQGAQGPPRRAPATALDHAHDTRCGSQERARASGADARRRVTLQATQVIPSDVR